MKMDILLFYKSVTPGSMIIIGLVIIVFLHWFFWPKKGGLALILKLKRNNKRILIEDALKFIFECEYNKCLSDVNSLAGHLNISIDKAGNLITSLSSLELIKIRHQTVSLTDAGRSYALRIIRVHRIWERYLADETSVSPAEWHTEADRIEHEVTEEETERLAAQMGNPVFDPHGDPIPSIKGELPGQKGKLLSDMHKGDMGRITHLEDEPKSIYEQLVVLGLYPGMQVYVTDVSDKKITFVANGEECVLTPLFAGYITVVELPSEVAQAPKYQLLSSLKIGEKAEITGISPNCRGQQRRRLMDLGIVPGSHISAVIKSASGDPMGYRVMGTTIGIRKQHADFVFINTKNQKDHELAK
jgi:DtxR family transcriptional regulator, Mn-dependent transcriptional regulator